MPENRSINQCVIYHEGRMKTDGKSQSDDSQQVAAQNAKTKVVRKTAAAALPPFTHRTPNRLHASLYARDRS